MNKINKGNAFELLKNETEKVNHLITDPPYNISMDNNFHTMEGRQGIDFG